MLHPPLEVQQKCTNSLLAYFDLTTNFASPVAWKNQTNHNVPTRLLCTFGALFLIDVTLFVEAILVSFF